MKCCTDTANKILEETSSQEWKEQKVRMIKKYGKVLSLVEMKELSVKEGKTLADFMSAI